MRVAVVCCLACIVAVMAQERPFLRQLSKAQERSYTRHLTKTTKATPRRSGGRPADRFRQPTPPTLAPDFTPPTPPKAEKLTPPTPPTPPQPLFLQPVTQPAIQRAVAASTPVQAPQAIDEDYVVGESEPTKDPRLTGDPRKDYIYDPNLPRELNNYDLSTYPFYISVPTDIAFDCAGRHDGYYASIKHFCQLFHYCVTEIRYDFLCANYTLFDQTTFTCRFVNNVNCTASEEHYDRNNALYEPTTTSTVKPVRRHRPRGRQRKTTTPDPEEYYDDEYEDEYEDEEEEKTTTTTTKKPRHRKTTGGNRRKTTKARLLPPKLVKTRTSTTTSTTTTTTTTTTTEPPPDDNEGEYYDEEE